MNEREDPRALGGVGGKAGTFLLGRNNLNQQQPYQLTPSRERLSFPALYFIEFIQPSKAQNFSPPSAS